MSFKKYQSYIYWVPIPHSTQEGSIIVTGWLKLESIYTDRFYGFCMCSLDKKEIIAMCRVLNLHKKHFNKWNKITWRDKSAEEVYWKPNYVKDKVRVDAVQISKCKSTDEFTDVDPMTVPKDERKHIV